MAQSSAQRMKRHRARKAQGLVLTPQIPISPYGVKREARRAVWEGKQNAISVIERVGEHGSTEIVVETIDEYKRDSHAPKVTNPLQ